MDGVEVDTGHCIEIFQRADGSQRFSANTQVHNVFANASAI
jgi:hypothetical protein